MINSIVDKTQLETSPAKEAKRSENEDAKKSNNESIVVSEDAKKDDRIDTEEALERIVSIAKQFNTKLHLELERDLGITIVKVVDAETDEVIRQIPPEELVELSKNAKDLKGLLINKEG